MNCAIIYNPNSGKGKQADRVGYISSRLKSKYEKVDLMPTKFPRHAVELAKSTCGKYDLLVILGGDGTLSEVVNGIAGEANKPQLGYIPQGTVNDVGHSIGMSTNYKKSVEQILNGNVLKHDVFKVNDRYGIYVCCAGVITETSYATPQKLKKVFGKMAYAFHGATKMFRYPSIPLTLTFDGGKVNMNCAFMLILNSRNVASLKVNRKARLDDGLVDIMLIREKFRKVTLNKIFQVLTMFLTGIKRQGVRLRLAKFHVSMPESAVINIDGEKAGQGEFDFEVLKNEIEFIV